MTSKENLLNTILKSIIEFLGNGYAVLCGMFTSIIGYFVPLKDIVHLLILFFVLDVAFGYGAAKKLRKEKFDVKIIWNHTVPRMVISIILIIGAFLWDNVYNQEIVHTYKIVGWFLSGVLLFSIVQNAYQITDWTVFKKLSSLFSKKIQEGTGVNIEDEK